MWALVYDAMELIERRSNHFTLVICYSTLVNRPCCEVSYNWGQWRALNPWWWKWLDLCQLCWRFIAFRPYEFFNFIVILSFQLLACRVASLFLVGHTREYVCIPYVIVRDILHEYLPVVSAWVKVNRHSWWRDGQSLSIRSVKPGLEPWTFSLLGERPTAAPPRAC